MTDKERITELERDISQLKQALRYFLQYVVYGDDYTKAAADLRKRGEKQFRDAEMLDGIRDLLA
jgi:hypothetical protein